MAIKLNGSTSGSVALDAPADTSPSGTDVTLTLPTSAGSSGQYLQTNGSGTLSWQTVSVTPDAITEGNTTVECVDTGSNGHITFDTEGSEAARFDSGGRLLINGTTSHTWSGGQCFLQVNGTSASGNVHLGAFQYSDSADGGELVLGSSRGTTVGANTVVQNNDTLGRIRFCAADGTDFTNRGGEISCRVDGTPGSDDIPTRMMFYTASDGAGSPTERMRILSNGNFTNMLGVYNDTTGAAANVNVNSSGSLMRSTSSAKYKTSIETLEDSYADALLNCRPVWYRSLCSQDNPAHGFWGFIAEEVAEIDPRLVSFKTTEVTYDEETGEALNTPCDPVPESVQYDRFVPHLVNLIKRQKDQIASLEARLTALEGGAA